MNNNNTENASDDVNTVLSIAPMYDSNSSNGNGGNQNVFNLTGNIQVIEDNHIDQNTHKIMFVRCLTSWFGWCIKFLKNLLILNPSKVKNARDVGLLSEKKRKQRKLLKACCRLLLYKMNRAAKHFCQIGECWLFDV